MTDNHPPTGDVPPSAPPPPPLAYGPAPLSPSDERTRAMLAHLSVLLSL
ncbi:MAG: hypothetical protein NZM11_09700 [Anaerolineales bacterium]|nr:hypothetical protein [Anaerolineales bacterium]